MLIIVSTRSVIPFLGAPEKSVFLKVTRNQEAGIQLERLNIDIKNLLPNSLLTSPIFDLDGEDIKQENNDNISEIRTEDTYDEVQLNDEIQARLVHCQFNLDGYLESKALALARSKAKALDSNSRQKHLDNVLVAFEASDRVFPDDLFEQVAK